MTDEEKYLEELKANGVEPVEDKEDTKDDPDKEPDPSDPEVPAKPEPEEDKQKEHLQEPKEQEQPRKRSIYDDFKDEKKDRKAAEARAEQAERERDELQAKLAAVSAAPTVEKQDQAEEDALAYAQKVNADPELVKRIIADARKGFTSEPDQALKKDLEDFKAWRAQNSKAIEQQMFNEEFKQSVPELKKLFPQADDTALEAMKSELDKLSHSKEWHDKPLDYIAFKHQDQLSTLVTPKKKGMESKGRVEAEAPAADFNPTPDFSKMTAKEMADWEAQYRAAGRNDSLVTNAQGKKIML